MLPQANPNYTTNEVSSSIKAPLISAPAKISAPANRAHFNLQHSERKKVTAILGTLVSLGFAGAGVAKLMIEHQSFNIDHISPSESFLFGGAALFAILPLRHAAERLGLFQCCSTDSNNPSPFSGLPVQHEGTQYIIRVEDMQRADSPQSQDLDSPQSRDTDSPRKYQFGVKIAGSEHFTTDTASTREFTMTVSESDAITCADDLLTHYINQKSSGDLEAGEGVKDNQPAKQDLLTDLTDIFSSTNPMNN